MKETRKYSSGFPVVWIRELFDDGYAIENWFVERFVVATVCHDLELFLIDSVFLYQCVAYSFCAHFTQLLVALGRTGGFVCGSDNLECLFG